jgi:hypothetical protein
MMIKRASNTGITAGNSHVPFDARKLQLAHQFKGREVIASNRLDPAERFEPSPALKLQQQVRDRVDRFLVEEPNQHPGADTGWPCLDTAAHWHARLKSAGFDAHIVTVDHNTSGQSLRVGGQRVPGKFHAFVTVGNGPDAIVVDGSAQQFFGAKETRADLPEVLVGRMSDIEELFKRHPKDLSLELDGDPHKGRYQPEQLARFVYGSGPFAAARETLN